MCKIEIAGFLISESRSRIHQQDFVMDTGGVCRTIACGTHGATPHLLKIIEYETEDTTGNEEGVYRG